MAVAQFERDLIRERTKAGLVAAKARGSKLGRPRFKMTPQREAILRGWKRTPNDRRVYVDLADALGCSIGKAHALANKKGPVSVYATQGNVKIERFR
jgi:DNA invertase Pin-like site-specific DNA recombinase